jgi:hypothetical protein
VRKPWVGKLDQIGEVSVWVVTGQFIRKTVDEEFTNSGQHFRFRFIPRFEERPSKTGHPPTTERLIRVLG